MSTRKSPARRRLHEPTTLETGQRWSYPLGDGRFVALQITEVVEGRPRAIAFETVFDSAPAASELDRAPHLRFDLAIFNRADADPRMFACFQFDAAVAPARATLVDVAPVREDAVIGAPNMPFSSTFAALAQRVWQAWHLREINGAYGRELISRPHHLRQQTIQGDLDAALRTLAAQPPPITLYVGSTEASVIDLRAIRAQAIALHFDRAYRRREVLLPAHVHTLSIFRPIDELVVRCAPEGPPLAVAIEHSSFGTINGLDAVRDLSVFYSSSYGLSAFDARRWPALEALSIEANSISAGPSDWDDALRSLRALSLSGLSELRVESLPSIAQVPALAAVSLDARCKGVKEVRERYKGHASVQRFTTGRGPEHFASAHYFTTHF